MTEKKESGTKEVVKKVNSSFAGLNIRGFLFFLAGAVSTGGVDITGDNSNVLVGLVAAGLAYVASVVNQNQKNAKIKELKHELEEG